MVANTPEIAISTMRLFLPALCRLALSLNITAKQLDEVLKESFVDVVSKDFGINGRPTNVSRTMIYTELSRAEINKIRKRLCQLDSDSGYQDNSHGIGSLLREWFEDGIYLDENNNPMTLPLYGEELSLEVLSRKYFSDVPVTAILKELVDARAVEVCGNEITPLRPFLYPLPKNEAYMHRMGEVMNGFLNTMHHNLIRDDDDASRVEFRTIERNVSQMHEQTFRLFLEKEAQGFCQRIDRWLKDKRDFETQETDECPTIGVGFYQISE